MVLFASAVAPLNPSFFVLPTNPSRKSWSSAAIVLGAVAVRLLYLIESGANPFFDAPVVDAQTYLEQARRIADGDLLGGDRAFWQPPMFPYFLAAFAWLFGDGLFVAVRVAHAVLGAISCLFLHRLALRVLAPTPAAVVAVAMALYGPLVYFEGELLSVALEVFLYLLLLVTLANARERPEPWWWLAAGAVGGLAALTRPNILLFLLLLAVALPFLQPRQPVGRCIRRLLAAGLGLACVVAPVTWRNAVVGGEFVLISANGGANFYIGNNANADSTVAIHPGQHWERLMAEPRQAGYHSYGGRSNYFLHRAFVDIAADPLRWAGLLARKCGQLMSGPEIRRNQDPYYAREHSRLLSALLWDEAVSFPHGLVMPLALLGLAATWRQRNATLELLRLFVVSYGLAIVLFFVTSRYRTPLAPAWLLFAGAGGVHLCARLGDGNWRRAAPALGAVMLVGVFVNLPAAPPQAGDAQLQHDLGEVMLRKERYRESLEHSRRAAELEPDYASAFHNMAVAWLALGQPRPAVEASRHALELYPERPKTRFQYARALWASGEHQAAVAELEVAVRITPELAEARHQLGRWLLRLGQAPVAVKHLQASSRARPDSYWTAYDLGRALHVAGRAAEAMEVFARAHALAPNRPEASSAAGAAALASGDLAMARRHLRQALAVDSTYVPGRVNMGIAELQAGNHRAGIDLLQNVLPKAQDPARVLGALARGYHAVGETERAREALEAASARGNRR